MEECPIPEQYFVQYNYLSDDTPWPCDVCENSEQEEEE